MVVVLLAIILIPSVFGNRQLFDVQYTFNRAVIYAPDGTIVESGEIAWWNDYDGEQLQVKFKNSGRLYLTSSIRCDLIED